MSKCDYDKTKDAPEWDDDYRNPGWCKCNACQVALYGEYHLDKHGCRVYHGRKK